MARKLIRTKAARERQHVQCLFDHDQPSPDHRPVPGDEPICRQPATDARRLPPCVINAFLIFDSFSGSGLANLQLMSGKIPTHSDRLDVFLFQLKCARKTLTAGFTLCDRSWHPSFGIAQGLSPDDPVWDPTTFTKKMPSESLQSSVGPQRPADQRLSRSTVAAGDATICTSTSDSVTGNEQLCPRQTNAAPSVAA